MYEVKLTQNQKVFTYWNFISTILSNLFFQCIFIKECKSHLNVIFLDTSEKDIDIKPEPLSFDQIEGNVGKPVTDLKVEHSENEFSIEKEEEIAQFGMHSKINFVFLWNIILKTLF